MTNTLSISFLLLCFCVCETLAWIRFREPPSRRNYVLQTPTETLQKCDITKNDFCKLCGEGTASTSDIPETNYTIIDRNTRILAIEVAFQTGLDGYLEFRLCNVTENGTMDAIVCRDVTPLLIGKSERWYPSSEQSYAQSRLRLPPELECERCVLQVKYTPGQRSVMANFRFFDCALLNISRPTVDLSSFVTTRRQTIKTNVNVIPGQTSAGVSSQNNATKSMTREVIRNVINTNINMVPGEAIDDSMNRNSTTREVTRRVITNASVNFIPREISNNASSQSNAANSITRLITRNEVVNANINLLSGGENNGVSSQNNAGNSMTREVTRNVITNTNINMVPGEATDDMPSRQNSANRNSMTREVTRNVITNNNINMVPGEAIDDVSSQQNSANRNSMTREEIRKVVTIANIDFVPGEATNDVSSQSNAANSITRKVNKNVKTNINFIPRETIDDVSSLKNSANINSMTREVIGNTNINLASEEATKGISSTNKNSQTREVIGNTINTNINFISGESINDGVSQNDAMTKNSAIRELTNNSTIVTTPQKSFPTDHAILEEEEMFSNGDGVDTNRRFVANQERRQFGHFGFNSGASMFPTRDINRNTGVNLRHTLTETAVLSDRKMGRVSTDRTTKNDSTMVVSSQNDTIVASNGIVRAAEISKIDDAVTNTQNVDVTRESHINRNVVTNIDQIDTTGINSISDGGGRITDDVANNKAVGVESVQSTIDREVLTDSSKIQLNRKGSAAFLEDEMTGGLSSNLVTTISSSQATQDTGFESHTTSTNNDRVLVEAITNDADTINRTFVGRDNLGIGLHSFNENKMSTAIDITNDFERNNVNIEDSVNKLSVDGVSNTLTSRTDTNNINNNTTGNNDTISFNNVYYDYNRANGSQYYNGNNDTKIVRSSSLRTILTNRTSISVETSVRTIETSTNAVEGDAVVSNAPSSAVNMVNDYATETNIGMDTNTNAGYIEGENVLNNNIDNQMNIVKETTVRRVNVPPIPTTDNSRITTDVSNITNLRVTVDNRMNEQNLNISGTGLNLDYARTDVNVSPANIDINTEPTVGAAAELKQQVITVPEKLPVFTLPVTGNNPNEIKLTSRSDRFIVRGENVHDKSSAGTILDLSSYENQYKDAVLHGSSVNKKITVHSQNNGISMNTGSITQTFEPISTTTSPVDINGNVDLTTNKISRNDMHLVSGATYVPSNIEHNPQNVPDKLNIQNQNDNIVQDILSSSSSSVATRTTTATAASENDSSINMTINTVPSLNQNLGSVNTLDAKVDNYLGQPTVTSSINQATNTNIKVLSVNQQQDILGNITDASGSDVFQNDKSIHLSGIETNTISEDIGHSVSGSINENEIGTIANIVVNNQPMIGRTDTNANINTIFKGQSFFTDGGNVDTLGGIPVATSEKVKSELKNTGDNGLVSTKIQNSRQTWSASNFDIGNTFDAPNALGVVVVDVNMDKPSDQSTKDRNTVHISADTITKEINTKRTIASVDESQRLFDNSISTKNVNTEGSVETKIGNNVVWQVMDVDTGRQSNTNIAAGRYLDTSRRVDTGLLTNTNVVVDGRVDTGRQANTNIVVDGRVDAGRKANTNIVVDGRVDTGRQANTNIVVDGSIDTDRQANTNIVVDRRVDTGRQANTTIVVDGRIDTGRQANTNIVVDGRVDTDRQANTNIVVDRRVDTGRQTNTNVVVDKRVDIDEQANTNIAVDRFVDTGRQMDANITVDTYMDTSRQADSNIAVDGPVDNRKQAVTNIAVNGRVDSGRQTETSIAVDKRIASVSSRGSITKDHLEMMVNGDAKLNNIHIKRPISTKAIQSVNVPDVMPPIDIKVDDSAAINAIRSNGNMNIKSLQSSEIVSNGGSTINSLLLRTKGATFQKNDNAETASNPSQRSGSTIWDITRTTNDEPYVENKRKTQTASTEFGQTSNNINKVPASISRVSSIQTSQPTAGTSVPRYRTVIYNTQPGIVTDTRQGSINSTMNAQVLRTLEALVLELKAFEDNNGDKDRKIFTTNTDKSAFSVRAPDARLNTLKGRSGSTVTGRNMVHSSYPLFRVHESMLTLPSNVGRTVAMGKSSLPEVRRDNGPRGSNNHLSIDKTVSFNSRRMNSLSDQRGPIVNDKNLLKAPNAPNIESRNVAIDRTSNVMTVKGDYIEADNSLNGLKVGTDGRDEATSNRLIKTLNHVASTNSVFDGSIPREDIAGLGMNGNEAQVPQTSEAVFQSIINVTRPNRNSTNLFSILSNNFASVSAGNRVSERGGINTNTETLLSINERNNNSVIDQDSATDNSAQQTIIDISPKIIKQSVVRTSSQMVNPFSGITIDLTKHNDTFLPRGSTRFENRIGLQQASDSRISQGFTPKLRQFQISNPNRQVKAGSNVAIEGKYFIGHMRRNAMGQFEPVYAASSMDAKGIVTTETKASPLDTATVQQPPANETPSMDTGNNVDEATPSTENKMSSTLTIDSRQTVNSNLDTLSAKPLSQNVEIISAAETMSENPGSSQQTIQRQFFNQDDLLNTFGISLTDNKNSEKSNESISCPEQEIFVCEAVGKNKQIPGMVWWCFSHCKNGFCPIDKCTCRCENTKSVMEKEVLSASHESSNDNTMTKNKRVKTVVTLTLNGSEKSTIPLDNAVSDTNLSSRDGAQVGSEKVINIGNDLALERNTVRVTSGTLTSQGGQLAVNDNASFSSGVLSCTGINAFVNTPGINEWCTEMCTNDVCPVDICNCS